MSQKSLVWIDLPREVSVYRQIVFVNGGKIHGSGSNRPRTKLIFGKGMGIMEDEGHLSAPSPSQKLQLNKNKATFHDADLHYP